MQYNSMNQAQAELRLWSFLVPRQEVLRFGYLTCEHKHKILLQHFMILVNSRLKYEAGKSSPETDGKQRKKITLKI